MQRTLNVTRNTYISYRGFLYRSPVRIREDIRKISVKVTELCETLNIRGLLMDMITECAAREPERRAGELAELTREVEESLESLKLLDGLLDGLVNEWREVKCGIGI